MCAMRQGSTRRSFALIYALLLALPSLPSASTGVGRCHCHRCCAQLDHAAMGKQAVVAGTRLVNCPRCLSGQCPAYCSGPASGCEGSGPGLNGVGCYGVAEVNGAAIGGNCVCETGEFSQPEVFRIMGVAHGLKNIAHKPGWGLVVTLRVSLPSTALQGVTSTMVQHLKHDGIFQFPFQLASGQLYQAKVTNVRFRRGPLARPAHNVECDVRTASATTAKHGHAQAQTASGVAFGNVNLLISCRSIAKSVNSFHPVPQHTASSTIASSTQSASTAAQKALLSAKAASAHEQIAACTDSPMLMSPEGGMTPAMANAAEKPTLLPCARSFTLHPEHALGASQPPVYITEVRTGARLHEAHKCAAFDVTADAEVDVCFVEAAMWYQLSDIKTGLPTASLLRNSKMCPTECHHALQCDRTTMQNRNQPLAPNTTYLLFVKESKDRSKMHFHTYSDLRKSYTPLHLHVRLRSCAAASQSSALKVASVAGLAVIALAVFGREHYTGSGRRKGYSTVSGQELGVRRG